MSHRSNDPMNVAEYQKPAELKIALSNIQDRLERLQKGLNETVFDDNFDTFQIKRTAYFGQAVVSPQDKENDLPLLSFRDQLDDIKYIGYKQNSPEPITHQPKSFQFFHTPIKEVPRIPNFHATIERFHKEQQRANESLNKIQQKADAYSVFKRKPKHQNINHSVYLNSSIQNNTSLINLDCSFTKQNYSCITPIKQEKPVAQQTRPNDQKPLTKIQHKCSQANTLSLIHKRMTPLTQQIQQYPIYRQLRDSSTSTILNNSISQKQFIQLRQQVSMPMPLVRK